MSKMTIEEAKGCPECGAECTQDEVDIGVGIQRGAWYCPYCGWDQAEQINQLFREKKS